MRQTLGRLLIRRETAAYRACAGIRGIPRFLGRLGPFRLATEWVDATPLSEQPRGSLPEECFERLDRILDALHDRDVALADLHHRDVLVDARGAVHVVDLATAWVLGPTPGRIRRRLFDRVREQDRVAAARIRARFLGRDVEAAVRAVGPKAAAWHRRGRVLKTFFDRLRGRRRH